MYSVAGLKNTRHVLEIRPLGTAPAGATGRWAYVDAVRVGTVLYQETNAAVVESLRRVVSSSASGGSYDTATNATRAGAVARPRFQLQFSGTRVTVYAVKAPTAGTAAVYIDNVRRATLNLHSSVTYRASVYSSPSLANSTHTIRIDVVGTTNGARSAVNIDYLTVR
jgi:hypothetical protein